MERDQGYTSCDKSWGGTPLAKGLGAWNREEGAGMPAALEKCPVVHPGAEPVLSIAAALGWGMGGGRVPGRAPEGPLKSRSPGVAGVLALKLLSALFCQPASQTRPASKGLNECSFPGSEHQEVDAQSSS